MEPVGLGVGLLGLAGLFSQVLECFEYIHVAHTMGDSYIYYSLRLDNAQLRLTRWRSSVDLKSVPENENDKAQAILKAIITIFDKAKDLSQEFEAAHPHDVAQGLQAEGVDGRLQTADGEHNVSALLEKMKSISFKRNPTNSKRKKTKWAVYSESHMKELVEKVSSLTTELVELFPAAKAAQAKLCDVEIFDLTEGLRQLCEAVKGQDDVLTSALEKMLNPIVSIHRSSVKRKWPQAMSFS